MPSVDIIDSAICALWRTLHFSDAHNRQQALLSTSQISPFNAADGTLILFPVARSRPGSLQMMKLMKIMKIMTLIMRPRCSILHRFLPRSAVLEFSGECKRSTSTKPSDCSFRVRRKSLWHNCIRRSVPGSSTEPLPYVSKRPAAPGRPGPGIRAGGTALEESVHAGDPLGAWAVADISRGLGVFLPWGGTARMHGPPLFAQAKFQSPPPTRKGTRNCSNNSLDKLDQKFITK